MALERTDVEKIAHLARLGLDPGVGTLLLQGVATNR